MTRSSGSVGKKGLTNAFQTPKPVPRRASSPISTGMEAMNVMAFELRANELNKIGPKGCTLVKPIRAKTTIYRAPVKETV